jgi:hypothetical protein
MAISRIGSFILYQQRVSEQLLLWCRLFFLHIRKLVVLVVLLQHTAFVLFHPKVLVPNVRFKLVTFSDHQRILH